VDAVTAVALGLGAFLLVLLVVVGLVAERGDRYSAGLRSPAIAPREALEAEDLDQMLALRNARSRARGDSELTVAQLEQELVGETVQKPGGASPPGSAWPGA
jgi:hypothetical protein